MAKPPRIVKPDPKDPDWKFPYAHRERIENLTLYFSKFRPGKPKGFRYVRSPEVLPHGRPNKIPWESVPPQYRARCQELFDRKIAQERAKGIPGWPTWGKINSVRMNCTKAGRHYFNGENFMKYSHYLRKKKMWLLYQNWLVQEERKKILAERGPERNIRLDIG